MVAKVSHAKVKRIRCSLGIIRASAGKGINRIPVSADSRIRKGSWFMHGESFGKRLKVQDSYLYVMLCD